MDKEKFRQYAFEVAGHLGYTLTKYYEYTKTAFLRKDDESGVIMTYDNKVNIRGLFDNGLHEHIPYGQKSGSINVSASRPPTVCAREIERRLLPEYLVVLDAAKKQRAEEGERKARITEIRDRLIRVSGGKAVPHDPHAVHIPGSDVYQCRVSSPDRVFFKLYVSPQMAAAILALIRDQGRKRE